MSDYTGTVSVQGTPDPIETIRNEADNALSARANWDERQVTWYKLRHSGLKRPGKPWKGAADMNWPLADMMIEKIKPYYIQQAFANELLANFYSLRHSEQLWNTLAAQWFDYQLRHFTNFETEIISVADYMLVSGKGILKIRWDEDADELAFDSVDPTMIIVPEGTVDLQDADWVIQVHQVSLLAYQRNDLYNQEIIDHIKTLNDAEVASLAKQEKMGREGITCTTGSDKVVLWEVFERQDDGTVEVFTFAPCYTDEYVKAPVKKRHGDWYPFVEFNAEIKDKGYYSSRGIPERVASMQMSMSKLWNEKLDAITVFNRPIFTSDNPMVNAGNIRMNPGDIIPFPVKKIPMDTPPINWDSEINQHRLTAEQLIGVPDAGLTQIQNNERRTASEVNLIGSIMSQVVDLRSRVFRKALALAFSQAWVMLTEERKSRLDFFYRQEMLNLPPAAVHPEYRIEPLASADNLNSAFVYRKKLERFQLLQGNPFVNQEALTRDLISAGDPQDVKSLMLDSNGQSASHAEDQATEISSMMIGFPSQVKPVDDDMVHLQTIKGFVERRISANEEISPELAALLVNHANMHLRQLQQKNPEQAAEVLAVMEPMATYLGTLVGQAQASQV